MRGLHPILLFAPSNVRRALVIDCPVCRESAGQACKLVGGKPTVHDARESLAFHGKKIWA